MRTQDTRPFTLETQRPIQVAVHKKSRPRLKRCRFNGVALVRALVLKDRLQRRAFGPRAKLGSGENLLPHRRRAHLPLREIAMCSRHALELLHRLRLSLIIPHTQSHFGLRFLRVNGAQKGNRQNEKQACHGCKAGRASRFTQLLRGIFVPQYGIEIAFLAGEQI